MMKIKKESHRRESWLPCVADDENVRADKMCDDVQPEQSIMCYKLGCERQTRCRNSTFVYHKFLSSVYDVLRCEQEMHKVRKRPDLFRLNNGHALWSICNKVRDAAQDLLQHLFTTQNEANMYVSTRFIAPLGGTFETTWAV